MVGPLPSDLVLAAVEVTGLEPHEVLAHADVQVVVGIAGRARDLDDPVAAASEVLVGVAAGRPFARGNAATAWLAAMHELAERGMAVEVDDDAAAHLVQAAAAGQLTERAVTERLTAWTAPVPGPLRHAADRIVAVASATRAAPSYTDRCPACGRVVGASPRWPLAPGLCSDEVVRIAVCAREHGAHDTRGRALARRGRGRGEPVRWCPVVFELGADDGPPFVAITDAGPVAFLPTDDHDELALVVVEGLTASDLVGSWDRLWPRGDVVGRVAFAACRFDEAGTAIDWPGVLATAVPGGPLVPA